MNKIIKELFIFCIALACISAPAYAEDTDAHTEGIFTYTVSGSSATITNIENPSENLVIPEKLGGYTVTAIAAGACGGSANVTDVVIADTVTSIGNMCFAYSPNIFSVKLPASLKSIGDGAFYQCENLWTITVPEGTIYIGDNAFAMCSNLTAATVPNSVTAIGPSAFPANNGFRIYASLGSDAKYYADTNNLGFEERIFVNVNGRDLTFDQPCITDTQNYKTLVPMRAVLESLNADVTWDDMMNMARIDVMGSRLLIRPEEPFMMIDGRVAYLSTPAIEFNYRLMLPIRDIIEVLGGNVVWNEETKLITVTCKEK